MALRVLMLVDDTAPTIDAAATMAAAGQAQPLPPPPTPSAAIAAIPGLPPQMQLDQSFAPVPVHPESAGQALVAAGMHATVAARPQSFGPGAYVVRGTIDAADLSAVTQATLDPTGQTRVFADPEVGAAQTCGGNPPVGTATDVQRLLQAGQLRRLGMNGDDVALAIV